MFRVFVTACVLCLAFNAAQAQRAVSPEDQKIIDASIARYPGSCACPYNRARNGSRCGKRSAWNKPGGYAPKCFATDISDRDRKAFRARQSMAVTN